MGCVNAFTQLKVFKERRLEPLTVLPMRLVSPDHPLRRQH